MRRSSGGIGCLVVALILFCSISSFAQSVEICNDGKDNNGDGKIDCNDSFCNFAVTIEKGCNCFDTKDNDGDGKVDAADTDCATYYGLTFVGAGSTCSIQPPAGTGFSSIAPPQSSSQNTADTPAKVVVGDMNGDGVPDVAVCSKWNSTLQIVATAPASGFATGDIMSDFTTPGSKIFPKAGSNYVFEHEVLIADINKDKIGEVFAIASERGGSPNNAPVRFFLTGFSYKSGKGNLNPLFDAVDLGTDRPGNPGIADFDGDGKAEVYLKNRIYAAESGVLLANPGGVWDTEINSGPVAVNVLGDNKLELVCGNFIYSVPSLSSRTLQSLTVAKDMNTLGGPKFYPKGFFDPTEYGNDQASTSSTADMDGDGFIDVLMTGAINCSGLEASPCGNNITTIFYWNVTKGTISTFTPPDPTKTVTGWTYGTGRINLGDANGDGKLEALFIAGNQLFCLGLDASGNLILLWTRTINDSLSGILSLTVYDFNNDGKPEVVYRDSQELVVIDGPTGQTKIWSSSCQSHTWTEGPVVADVNGDGNTDICTTCYTSNAFDPLKNTVQQQSLGQTRLYFSTTNAWLPTRKIWNQHPYYVTNIKDDLTLPFPQIDPSLVFSNAACPNGLPGPQRPLNLFMNQVPRLSKDGCPEFPAPDLTFTGDTPSPTGIDTNGDGVYTPTVVVTPPICGDVNITAYFNIINNGDLPISDNVPVSFYNGDPTANPVTATFLAKTSLTVSGLQVGQKLVTSPFTFPGPGTTFKLYIVLYNDGTTTPLPISLVGQSTKECSISNNIYSVDVTPDPFSATIQKIADNFKCANSAPDNGELKAHIFKGTTEVTDFSPYAFQWYTGSGTGSPIAAPAGISSDLTGRAEGTYTLVVTNTQKGCSSTPVEMAIVRQGNDPDVSISLVSDQTKCSPPDGSLLATVATGNTGYTFDWYDISLKKLGIVGPQANGLVAGSYVVLVSKDGCTKTSAPATVNGPKVPDATAKVLQNVVDCSNPASGSIQADAVFNGVVQNSANYTFNWYLYNNVTSTRGSILPAANGTGPVRTGLAAGYYQAEVKDNITQCTSTVFPVVQVTTQTIIPTAQITQVLPQTSCDPLNPNGILTGNALVSGVVQDPATITFEWFKGQNTLPANLVSTVSGTNGQTVNKVAGGGIPYTLKITTQLHCSSTTDFTIQEIVKYPVLTLAELTKNSVCDATLATTAYNGSVIATVTFNGASVTLPDLNYTFSWYNGTTTATPHNPATSQNNILTGLKDGNYAATVTRTDLSCVSVPQTTPVGKATVLPLLNPSSTGSNNCDPSLTPDGTVSVSVGNAIAGDVFTYQWYSGNAVIAGNKLTDAPINHNSTTSTAINVGGPAPVGSPVQYTVEVLNKTTGCINNVTEFVADKSVVPVLSTSTTPNSICSPSTSFNGSMTVSVTNIPALYTIADYAFTWYDGNTTALQHSPQPSPVSTATLSKLDVGTYSVIGKNTKTGCVSTLATDQVITAKVFPALLPTSTGSNNCDVSLTPDGTASYSVTNLAQSPGPFTQQWYVGSGDPISGGFPTLPAGNNGTSVTATKLGGPDIPVGSAPRYYTVLVKNTVTGCTNFTTASVTDNSVVPVLSTTVTANSMCDPTKFNGTMSVSVTNIPVLYTITDYAFTWKNSTNVVIQGPSAATLLNNLDVGSYSVIGENTKTGCISSVSGNTVPDQKVLPVIQINTTGSHNCDPGKTPDGTAIAIITNTAVVNGAGPFTYLWTAVAPASAITVAANNADQATAIKLGGPANAPNTYSVKVTNTATGCVSNSSGLVGDVSAKPTFTLLPFDNTICDKTLITSGPQQYNGHVDISAVNNNTGTYTGAATLSYSWFDVDPITSVLTANTTSPTNTSTSLTLLDNAKYAATVTIDELGCTSDPVTAEVLDHLTFPVITPSIVDNTNCPGGSLNANGSAAVSSISEAGVGAALASYTYKWFDGAVVDPLNLRAENSEVGPAQILGTSTFIVQVTNKANGCQGSKPMTVTDVKIIPTIALSLVQNNTQCSGTPNGELLATVSPAGPTYTISWTGSGTQSAAPGDHFTELAAASYSATAQNTTTGCTSAVDSKSITDNFTYPLIAVTPTPQTSCDTSAPNGVLTATNTVGGSAVIPVTYTWYDGAGTTPNPTHSQTSANSGIIDQLAANTSFTVEVKVNATGCTSTQTSSVADVITHPTVSFTGISNVTVCSPTPDGSATVAIAGLSAPTDYDLYYVFTSAFSSASYPTAPANIKTAVDPANHTYSLLLNQLAMPTAYGNMIPGYLTALVVDRNTTCESNPATQQILDNTSQNVITINGKTQAGFCGGVGGGIDISVTGGVGAHTYEWYHSTPTNSNINFFNQPPVFGTGVVAATEDLGMPGTPPGVNSGVYTVVVRDANGCGAYFVDNVPFANQPTITVTPTDVTKCVAPFDGQVAVNVTGVSATGYTIQIFSGNAPVTSINGPTATTLSPVNLSSSNLASGDYYIQVIDQAPANVACPLGSQVTLKKLALPPVITIDQIDPNTSCIPGTNGDGKVTLTITDNPLDNVVAPKNYEITNINPLPIGGSVPIPVGISGTQVGPITGFKPLSYTISVEDLNSHCTNDAVILVPDMQALPSQLSIAAVPETACDPLSNGKATVSLAGGEPTNQFDFDWFKNNNATGSVTGSVAGDGAGTGGELINQSKVLIPADWAMGAIGTGSGNRTYYVQGIKNATAPTGVGCKTEIKQVVILDQHITPDITLVPAFDSFCLATAANGTIGDGTITITADADPGTAGQQNAAAGFDYSWTTPNAGLASPQMGQSNHFVIPKLGDGTYTVTATNATNKCIVTNAVTIDPAPYVITIDDNTLIDQRICTNDGRIKITQITLSDNSVGSPNTATDTDTDVPASINLQSLYTFQWYNNAALTAGTELNGVATSPIIAQTLSNDSDKDGITLENGDYAAMGAGTYYVVATRSDNTKIGFGCPSLPYRVDVNDVHKNPIPTLTVLSNTSCLSLPGSDEGEIIVNIADNTSSFFKPVAGFTYAYAWSGPAATLPTNGNGSGNGANGDFVGDTDDFIQLRDDPTPYAVLITNNQTGCTTNASATIIKNATPVFVQTVDVLNQLICGPDGSLTVSKVSLNDRNGVGQDFFATPPALPPGAGDIADFYFEWTRVDTPADPYMQTTTGNVLNAANYDAPPTGFAKDIGAGTYLVTAKRNNGVPGAGCKSAPYQVDILDRRLYPSVTVTPFANTSCDPTFFEGEIRVKVTDNSLNAPVGGFKFDYNWTASASPIALPVGTITTLNDGDGFGTGENDGVGVDNDDDYISGLQENTVADPLYTVEVTNETTLCKSTGSTIIYKNGTPVFTQLVVPTDQFLCGFDGKLEIKEVRLVDKAGNVKSNLNAPTDPNYLDLGDFDFQWGRGNPSPGAPIAVGHGSLGAVSGGTILDKPFYPTIGFDTYYVVSTRISGFPGKDCKSAPYNVDILDKRIFPTVSMTPLANTSCTSNPLQGEGEIKVKVTDASTVALAYTYSYAWDNVANPTSITTAAIGSNDGDGFGGGELDASTPAPVMDNDEDHPKLLFQGDYKITVTNNQTTCQSTGTTTIYQNSTPVFTAQVDPTPQITCNPSDAKLEVIKVTVTDRGGLNQSAPLSQFDYIWSSGTIANVVKTTQGINGAVSGGTILDNNAVTGYPAIANGTYFTVSKRVSGFPGIGCVSAPYKVDIDDQREYPKVDFTSLANSSCNIAKPNGSITAIASEQDGTNTDGYSFAWTLNGQAIASVVPTPPSQADATPKSVLTQALDGDYIVTATNSITGCAFDASFNLLLDQVRSTPNVIDVDTVDPLDCNPSASATVTKITLGSQTNSTLFPPNIPPNNEITGPALATFVYEWSSGTPGNVIAGVTTPTASSLSVGNYYVAVQDPTTDCKSGPKEVVITDDNIIYPEAIITQTKKQLSCITTTGTAELAATGDGQSGPPYTFTWYPTLDATGSPINSVSVPVISNLMIGNYSVEVLNTVTQCSAKTFYIVPDDAPFYTPVLSLGGQPRTLCVGQDGAVLSRVTNLDPTYPFPVNFTSDLYIGASPDLSQAPDFPNMSTVPGPAPQVSFIQYNLPEGFYTVRVIDNNTGCIGIATEEIEDDRTPPVVVVIEDNPLTICDPARANGQLSATGDGRVGGNSFDWYAGSSITTPPGTVLSANDKLIGQGAGTYIVRVTIDLTGCTADQTGTITDATVTPPIPTALVVSNRTNCINPNGWVTANVDGIVFNYDFKWYDGPNITASINHDGSDYQDLDVGPYTVTATDLLTGCVSPPATATVLDKRVNPEFTFETTPSYCADTGKPKGVGSVSLVLTNSGDVFLDDVQWYDITTNANVGSGVEVYELFPGFYKAEAVTIEGCTNEGLAQVKTEINPYNGVSVNGDSQNDYFIIDCITNFPDNNVKIFNRSGIMVYEINGYDNADFSFKGFGKEGLYLQGKELPVGTYFYIIDKRDGSKPLAGYLELNR
jgi:hypothetical protein